jgi:hypothetical protein
MSLMLVPSLSKASEWSATPQVSAHLDYWDNPRLVYGGGSTVEGGTAELSAAISRRTERSDISISPSIRLRRYSGDENLDGTDDVIHITAKQLTERATWTFAGTALRDTTLTSELGTTGFTQVNKRRDYADLSLGPSFQITERFQLSLGVYGLSTHYEDNANTGLLDYRYASASITGTRQVNERSQLAIAVNGGRNFVPDAPVNEMKNYSATLQYVYQWNPTWNVTLWGGPSRVTSEFSTDNGKIYGVSLRHQGERFTIDASAERNARPTGSGIIEQVDAATLSDSFRITERLSSGVGLSYTHSRESARAVQFRPPDVKYLHVDANLTWQCMERLNIVLSAGRNTQRSDFQNGTAKGYLVSVGFNWLGMPKVFWH